MCVVVAGGAASARRGVRDCRELDGRCGWIERGCDLGIWLVNRSVDGWLWLSA